LSCGEPERQAACLAARRGEDPSVLPSSAARSRVFAPAGRRCHELRIVDSNATWRIIYRIDDDAIIMIEVFSKKTTKTPMTVIDVCVRRLKEYDNA
jgi:phage-related protein